MRAAAVAAIFSLGFLGGLLAAQGQEPAGLPAERVTGIGGVFFKARDPKALGAWYQETLGVQMREGGGWSLFEWSERGKSGRAGTTVWSLFAADSDYFAPSQASFMVNYRVRNLDRMLAQLKAQGVRVEPKVTDDFNGRFAWAVDPEGNKIELWEPKEGY